MRLKDNYWDIFELLERTLNFYEKTTQQFVDQYISPSTKLEDRVYVALFIRAEN